MDGLEPIQVPLAAVDPGAEPLAAQWRSGDRRSIERAAVEFEGLFISLLIKEMRQTIEEDTLFSGDAGDTYGGLFDLYMGKYLAEAGGLGVAEMLKRHYKGPVPTDEQPPALGKADGPGFAPAIADAVVPK